MRAESRDARLVVDRRVHEGHERVTALVAAKMKDARQRVRRLACGPAVETNAKRLQPPNRLGAGRGQHRDGVGIA